MRQKHKTNNTDNLNKKTAGPKQIPKKFGSLVDEGISKKYGAKKTDKHYTKKQTYPLNKIITNKTKKSKNGYIDDTSSEDDLSDGFVCPACSGTKYKCEQCGKTCCSPCAQYDAEFPDITRGHGNFRNHIPGDKRCGAI